MVIRGMYMFEFSVDKDMKKMLLTLADERSSSKKVGRHP